MSDTKKLSIVVCKGPSCSMSGADELVTWCRDLAAADLPIQHDISGCTGNCCEAPVVDWNGLYMTECSPESLTGRLIEDGLM